MKLETQKLLAALKGPTRLAGGRVSIPVLSSVLLRGAGGRLSVRANNFYAACLESVEAEGELDPVLVRGDVLGVALAGMGGTTELQLEKSRLVLRGDCTTKLSCATDEKTITSFPEDVKPGKGIGVNCADLARAMRSVLWASAKYSDRTVLQTVYVHGAANALECVACDGASLAFVEMPAISAEFEVLIPHDWARWVADALGQPGAVLKRSESDTQLVITHDAGWFACPLVSDKYPNWRTVVPKDASELGEINRERWIESLGLAVSLGATGDAASVCTVALKFDAVGCALSMAAHGHDWQTAIGGKFGKAAGSFSASKLVAALNSFESATVKLLAAGGIDKSPLVMKSGNQTVVMMPWKTK